MVFSLSVETSTATIEGVPLCHCWMEQTEAIVYPQFNSFYFSSVLLNYSQPCLWNGNRTPAAFPAALT